MAFSILYVCTGNICRSPLAERLLRARLDTALGDRAGDFIVSSAGTHGWEGSAMDRTAAAELTRLGGDPQAFRGRLLAARHIETADLVLTATRSHRSFVLGELPEALKRTFTMCEFAHLADGAFDTSAPPESPAELVAWAAGQRGMATLDNYDITDPYGAANDVHLGVADQIAACVDQTVAALTRTVVSPAQ